MGRFDDFERAGIDAEFDTGERELTDEAARSNVFVRVARMTGGGLLVLLGVAMLVLPGPGLAVIALGLVILSRDVAWADRALRYVRRKAPGIDEEGDIDRSTIVVGAVLLVAGIALSLYFAFGY